MIKLASVFTVAFFFGFVPALCFAFGMYAVRPLVRVFCAGVISGYKRPVRSAKRSAPTTAVRRIK